ncbi:hypothetical protein BASA83_006457 [Batrachochytrium salamandrivorans]|nr:hypothetical protein BASA83_006457 [Batrachochytrium salamandrivorans]
MYAAVFKHQNHNGMHFIFTANDHDEDHNEDQEECQIHPPETAIIVVFSSASSLADSIKISAGFFVRPRRFSFLAPLDAPLVVLAFPTL